MWVPYVTARMTTHGVTRAIGVPGVGYPVDAPWADRARRAHLNAIENLAVFAPLVLVAAIVEVSTKATVLSAQIYVVARLVHYVIYTVGIPVIRTIAFLAGAIAMVVIAAVLLLSAV
nr:MAPEG family protein [Bradyrhizobium sp. dw_411]